MILIEQVRGNRHDTDWSQRLAEAEIDLLKLDQWDAQKNRFRKRSEGGVELAVSLQRGSHLKNGDILIWDEENRKAVIADIALKEVLVIETAALLAESPEVMLRTALELGHALGNQHWPAVVKGAKVYVPMAVDRKVMASVMKTHAFEGISYEFIPGDEVIPYLAPHESRRLFGGAETAMHSHAAPPDGPVARMASDHAHEHSHSSAGTEQAGHSHEHGDHSHSHEHKRFRLPGDGLPDGR